VRRIDGRLLAAVAWLAAACSSPRAPPAGAEQSSTRAEAPPPDSADLDGLILQGQAAYDRSEIDSARSIWRSVLSRVEATRDSSREARVLTSLGLAARLLGDYADSRALGERALAIKLRIGLRDELFRSYNALGLLAWNEGRHNDALALFQKALEAAVASGDQSSLAKLANNTALVQSELGHFSEARLGFVEAERAGRQLGDTKTQGRALINLGMLEVQLGDPGSALSVLTEARRLARLAGDLAGEQNVLGQLGSAYDALGEPRLALAALDTALALSREQGLRQEEASNLELIAGLHRQAGDLHRALDLFVEANRINGELGLQVEQGTNLRNVAEIHSVLGRPDLARENAAAALSLHRTSGARLQELRDLLLLADLSASASEPAAIVEGHLRTAKRLVASLDARVARVEYALAEATIADRREQARIVLQALRASREDLARGGFGAEWQAAALRARAYRRLGLLDSAASAGREAVAALERVRGGFGSSFLRTSYAVDKAQPYGDLVDILLRLERPAEAFEVADGARSRALLEHLEATSEESALSRATVRTLSDGEALLRRVDTLVARLDALEDVPPVERDAAARSQSGTLASELVTARSEYEALLVRAAERDAAGTALLGGSKPSAAEVQRFLRPDEALLEYLVTPERVIAFVVTAGAVRSVATGIPREDLARRVRLARDILGTPGAFSDAESGVLGALHAVLIAPLERAELLRKARRLIIVPHSVLTYLPFAALRQEGTSRFLIEDYTLLHLPSSAALAVVRKGAGAASIGAKAAVFAPFGQTLPGSAREARTFRQTVPGAKAWQGGRATEAKAREALAAGGIVHLATHGIMNSRNPMFSRLELARGEGGSQDDGRLEVHELLALRIAAPLVFLSGCETGVGTAWSNQFSRGEDFATLAQAFLFAGAQNVAATLWPISDGGAAAFAERFYTSLREAAPADALAAAQRESLKGARYSSPYYWAGYQLIGASELLPGPHKSTSLSVQQE
jgi:CHAT domain-containing protein